jgi:hypothetical protein
MTVYEIEQMLVLVQKYRVEASSEAEAIIKVFDGDVEPDSIELADLCDERGLSASDYPELADQLRRAGVMTDETVIPSICGIEQVAPSLDPVVSRSELPLFGSSG